MSLVINTNIASLIASRNVGQSQGKLSTSISHLSSGLRIASAADDAAGLAISEQLKADTAAYGQAARNANDGVSALQVAEGGLTEVSNILVRMKELATEAATGTISNTQPLDDEFQQLLLEITRVSTATKFNGTALVDGSFNKDLMVGTTSADTLTVDLSTVDITGLTNAADVLTTAAAAKTAMGHIDTDIASVAGFRGTIGSLENRLNYTVGNLQIMAQNTAAAASQITDADYATEMSNFTKNQVLQQAGVAILAQANSLPQSVLKLVG